MKETQKSIKKWQSVQYHSDNVDKVNKKLEDINSRVEEIKLDKITEDLVTKTKNKLAHLEDRSRWNKLRSDGFQEETNETWEESGTIITDFVKEKLRIEEDILIERAITFYTSNNTAALFYK